MNRLQLSLAALPGALMPLVFDSALKGAALLAAAALYALVLYKASAATRHLVWLVAVVALLIVPVLSVVLPGWRVLPQWAVVAAENRRNEMNGRDESYVPPFPAAESTTLPEIPPPAAAHSSYPSHSSHSSHLQPAVAPRAAPVIPAPALPAASGHWLPLAWAAGFAFLALRLLVAHLMLRRAARRCTALTAPPDGFIAAAFTAACAQLGIRRRVTLLLDEKRTIPVVWGVFRPQLLLPAEAREWNEEQLRSVLLHELAHIRRRDTLVQWITQIACALHWFNPLVWLAAWRLHAERERACDDLVLASGVRPSAYAEHLLHVATKLSPARWTAACGLAMARKSSLEGRLLAVLSEKVNRRSLTRALTAAALLLGTAVAIPIAMLRAQDEKTTAASDKKLASTQGAALTPGAEAQLDWGEAVNGLRGAVVVRSTQPGAPPGIFLAVQNVSAAALRFSDTIAAEASDIGKEFRTLPAVKLRTLYVSAPAGRILFALSNGEPTKTDAVLQPREVAFLRMMPPDKTANEKSAEAALIEGLRKDSLQTWKAVLGIEKAPEGAWKGKLTTGQTRGAVSAEGPQPKTEAARALFKLWQSHARLNGDIPGGLLSRLHDKVKEFIRNNTGNPSGDAPAKKLALLEPRFGAAGDWKPADVVALLDDIAAGHSIPLEMTMFFLSQHTLRNGPPLPAALQNADWGEPLPGGLRMVFLLEPRAEEYHLGTEVKARILLHNSGKEPVAFITENFQQPGHKAKLAGGADFKVDSTYWTTLPSEEAYRLGPGEFCEVNTPGIGIGAQNKDRDNWANVRAGSWILCGEGHEVELFPGPVGLSSGEEGKRGPGWWLEFIAERLGREAPVPMDVKEREYLLYRVVRELFGTAPSVDEGNAFAADKSPDALGNLAIMLSKRKYITPCDGVIAPGVTKFRVLPPDPNAGNRLRVARYAGRYNLGDGIYLDVTSSAEGRRVVNDGRVNHYPPGKDVISHDLKLPDGYNAWAAAWGPGTTVMWVAQKGLLRKVDFTNPAKVEETRFEGDKTAGAPIPADIREALRAALDVPDAPKQVQEPLTPAAPAPATLEPEQESKQPKQGARTDETKQPAADPNAAKPQRPKLPDKAYTRTGVHYRKFREEDAKRPGGELMSGVSEARQGDGPLVPGLRLASDAKWTIGGVARVELAVRNASSSDVKFAQTPRSDNGLSVVAIDKDGKEFHADIAQFDGLLVMNHLLLPPGHVVRVKAFTLRFDAEKRGVSEPGVAAFHLPFGDYTLRCKWNDARPDVAHEGEWTGELVSVDHKFTLSAPGAPASETPKAGAPRRKVDWNKFPHYSPPEIPFANPFLPEDALQLAAASNKSKEDFRRLTDMIHQATAEKAAELRPLLNDDKLRAAGIENDSLGFALAAYDYSVNGNKTALQRLLDSMASDPNRNAETAAWSLVYVDEWEMTLAAWLKHFGRFSNAEEHDLFWNVREFLYPERYAAFVAKQLADAKLDPASLRGEWQASKDGVSVELRFGEKVEWEVRQGDKLSKEVLTTHTDATTLTVHLHVPRDSKGWITYGFLRTGDASTLRLHLTQRSSPDTQGNPPGIDLVLTKQADAHKPQKQQESQQPKVGAQLKSKTEQKLKWGEPANGLRMALAWPPTLGEAGMGDAPEFYLVVQNVSETAVRLTANDAAPNPRRLMMRSNGSPLSAISDPTTMPGDWLLQPREVAFLRMFQPAEKLKDGRTISAAEEEAIRVYPQYSLTAEMSIEKAPAGGWTGKLATAETRGSMDVIPPKNKHAQELYKTWQAAARADGKIPGGLIGRLRAKVEEFVRINRDDASGAPYAKKVEPILPRLDASHDWSPDEAVKLLHDLAALSDIPINTTLEAEDQSRVRPGEPLPANLKDAPWGEPSAEGLRVARPLDPGADSYPLGMALRSRILLHNSGREPVLLRTKSWMQPGYEARDASGKAVNVESTHWTTLGQVQTWRLAPGDYMEILTPGLGVGKGAGRDEWADVRVGSWLEATEPADITLSPGAVSVSVDDSRGSHIKNGEQLKLEVISERLDRESPLPASAADREKIVRRVTKDIFGVDPTADEIAAFVSSKSSDPISALANRLLERAGLASFVGEVKPGEIKFRTTPADPDAANRPKVAIGPGRYTIGDNARLIIVGKPVDGRRTSDVELRFWAADQKSEPPGQPHKIEVPDGFGTWAITCRPGTGVLYVLTKGAVRKIDYSNPAQVKETPVTRGSSDDMPDEFREAVKRILTISGVPDEQIGDLTPGHAR